MIFPYSAKDEDSLINQSASGLANDCAAVADARKPAKVTPIWIVARKFDELDVSLSTCCAFLCPFSAILRILLSLSEITAISDAAKNAFTKIRNSKRIS